MALLNINGLADDLLEATTNAVFAAIRKIVNILMTGMDHS